MKCLWLLLVVTLGVNCKNSENTRINSNGEKNTFIIELPKAGPDLYYQFSKSINEQLSLKELEKGVDSLELRLTEHAEITNLYTTHVLKLISNEWKGYRYHYWKALGRDWKSINIDSMIMYAYPEVVRVKVKSALDSMLAEGLMELPSQHDIKGFESRVSDGTTYYFEIATKNRYKFYYYNTPEAYDYPECVQMTKILDIWRRNIGGITFNHMRKQ